MKPQDRSGIQPLAALARDRSPTQRRGRGVGGVLRGSSIEHVERLKELLAANEASEAEADPDWADRAAFDGSPAFERHRRYQSAKTRELHRTLDALRKMRDAEFGTGNEEDEMANGECTMAEEQCEVEAGGGDQGQTGELTSAGCSGPIVGQDFDLVRDDSTNDTMGTLSYVGTDAVDGASLGEGVEQSLACDVKTLEKAPNEPNLESMQSVYSQRVEPENAELAGRERSQSAAGEQVIHDAGDERVETMVPKAGIAARLRAAKVVRYLEQLRSRGFARYAEKASHILRNFAGCRDDPYQAEPGACSPAAIRSHSWVSRGESVVTGRDQPVRSVWSSARVIHRSMRQATSGGGANPVIT